MPYYYPLTALAKAERKPIIAGLKRLRAGFRDPVTPDEIAAIPQRNLRNNLLLATWNIREFDSGKGGARSTEAIYYIAEIIDQFDLVAVQEVKEDLAALERVMSALGKHWKYICTDVTLGTRGSGERMAFLFDTRKVNFTGIAGELVVPGDLKKLQFARTPFVTGWQCGWARFSLCTVHIYYGDDVANEPTRVNEIQTLVDLLGKRTRKRTVDRGGEKVEISGENLVLLGDFNIFGRGDKTMEALVKNNTFTISPQLQEVPGSNVDKKKHYDQIACGAYKFRFEPTDQAGIFDYYQYVFRDDKDAQRLKAQSGKTAFKTWRSFQMSDHLVMWQEFKIDFADEYLDSLETAPKGG